MERKNNFREIRGGTVRGVAVCPNPDCNGGSPYKLKTESPVRCTVCKDTFMCDPVAKLNWMPYEDYRQLTEERREREKEEKEKKVQEDQEYKESLKLTRWEELAVRNQRVAIRKEEIEARAEQKKEAVSLLRTGMDIPEISKKTGLSRATIYRLRSGGP